MVSLKLLKVFSFGKANIVNNNKSVGSLQLAVLVFGELRAKNNLHTSNLCYLSTKSIILQVHDYNLETENLTFYI